MGVIAVTFRKILVLLRVIDRLKEDLGAITDKLILFEYKRKLTLQNLFKNVQFISDYIRTID